VLLNVKMGLGFTFDHDYEVTVQMAGGYRWELMAMFGRTWAL
jgi:hypothetical protein